MPDDLDGRSDLDSGLRKGHQRDAAGVVLEVQRVREDVAGVGRAGGRPAANVVHLPGFSAPHLGNGTQRQFGPLNSQKRFQNRLVGAGRVPAVVRRFHHLVRQEQSAADVHTSALRQSLPRQQNGLFPGGNAVGIQVPAMGGGKTPHKPRPVPRVQGAARPLAVDLFQFQLPAHFRFTVEYGGYQLVRRAPVVHFIPGCVVIQTNRRAHGGQEPV